MYFNFPRDLNNSLVALLPNYCTDDIEILVDSAFGEQRRNHDFDGGRRVHTLLWIELSCFFSSCVS